MPSSIDEAVALLPVESPLREIVGGLVDADPEQQSRARDRLRRELRGRATSEAEALGVVRAATTLEFPPSTRLWDDPASLLLTSLLDSHYPSLVAPIRAAYGAAPDSLRTDLLALLAGVDTADAVRTFVETVRTYGWPASPYQRLFWNLSQRADYMAILFPDLLLLADRHLVSIGNIALGALQQGRLDARALAPAAEKIVEGLVAALERARVLQPSAGGAAVAWRYDDEYAPVRSECGLLLDFAGWIGSPALVPVLADAAQLADPWLALFAAISLLRQGAPVEDALLERIAASHEARPALFGLLESAGAVERFPAAYLTREAFAASDLVGWLQHPSELGREPDELELMAHFEATRDDEPIVLYVWRFRNVGEPWLAGVSGVYSLREPIGPVGGSSTFSKFEPWESATAEEHASRVLETLAEWQKARE